MIYTYSVKDIFIMKGVKFTGIVFSLYFLCQANKCFAYSHPSTWDKKKETVIRLATDFIANREKFSDKCYKDGHGYSAGYGDFAWCDDTMKVLRWKNPILKLRSDDYVRKQVRITKDQAKWRLKKFVITVYDNLENRNFYDVNVVNYLDEKELIALIDNAYTRGETNFYKDPLWHKIVKRYIDTGKMNCVETAHIVLKQSKRNNGVLARRLVELQDFTHRNCAYDVKFLVSVLKQYKR